MQKITYLEKPIYFESHAAVGGFEEGRGPLGECFDLIDEKDLFGMKTWEKAEGEMSRLALNLALKKKDPVDADGGARKAKQGEIFADGGEVQTFFGKENDQQQSQRTDDASCHGDGAGGEGQVAAENADGAEDHHGKNKRETRFIFG